MNDKKEKSAVGMAAPATEIENITKVSIADESVKIKVVLQKSEKISEITEIENSIGTTNDIVGGLSTEVTIPRKRSEAYHEYAQRPQRNTDAENPLGQDIRYGDHCG